MHAEFWDWAEEQALTYRRAIRLRDFSPLPAPLLANHLEITILRPERIPGMTDALLHYLLRTYRSCWSAFTLPFAECTVIIYNTTHSPGRCESDLMHEMSHVLCNHRPVLVVPSARFPFPIRGFDGGCEREATGLGACLLLPRPALEWALQRRTPEQDILALYRVSPAMLRWRLQVTGLYRYTPDLN